ncbi:MAG: UDP-glucose 4-epimerase GalE [Bacteroidia bacterium]|nr:UDP-glucose 4-epimerase GalE [Bacteroidia bacterium]
MPKILITGGCGYIGSHTAIELLSRPGYEVISVDNLVNSSARTLDRIEQISGRRMHNYEVDVCDKKALEAIFESHKDIEGVIHFAALKAVGESVAQPLRYYHNNLVSLINILHCCEKYAVKAFIFSSSCTVYGNIEDLPVTEKTPTVEAESPYGNTKLVGEQIIRDFIHATRDIRAIALRYFNPVGAHHSGLNGEDPINRPNNLVPVITQTAVGIIPELTVFGGDYDTRDGSNIRDYIHVTDIAIAHIQSLEYLLENRNESRYEQFNLGSGQGISVLEAIKAFETVTGVKLKYRIGDRRPGDVVAIYSDSSLAKEKLGWVAQRGIEEMMASAWKWQQTVMGEIK